MTVCSVSVCVGRVEAESFMCSVLCQRTVFVTGCVGCAGGDVQSERVGSSWSLDLDSLSDCWMLRKEAT